MVVDFYAQVVKAWDAYESILGWNLELVKEIRRLNEQLKGDSNEKGYSPSSGIGRRHNQ